MAKPIKFEEAASTWVGSGDTGDLPVYNTAGGAKMSCWKLSLRERLYTLFVGKVWLTVYTNTHPAVNIEAGNPWE